ncbi:MAG: ATP-binding protein [Candidatus Azobacteroides sp.]|nr:ATP-binding protein [Candidatus Azobacteroides sp.]
MDKDKIKDIIKYFQDYAAKVEVSPRPIFLEEYGNYVFVGLRRVGKTYMLFQQIQQLILSGIPQQQILYINFEEERLAELTTSDLSLILDCYSEMFDYKPILFLDEIQLIDKWEKFARRLADSKYRVYISGSNAKMLSGEIATTLGGRYLIKEVYPLSFREYVEKKGIELSENWQYGNERIAIIKAFEEYFYYGGLPELLFFNEKHQWLNSLYQKIFFGDLIARYDIRNSFAMKILVKKLAESVRQPISYSRMANIVSTVGIKIGKSTIIEYVEHLTETWLVFSLPNYIAKLADRESNRKYYFADNGILNLFLFDGETALLENLVAIELRKRYGDELFFYNKNVEVDFFLPEQQMAIQACYSLSDTDTRKREVNALLQVSKQWQITKLLIITKDDGEIIVEDAVQIEVVPIWKWLLNIKN